MKLQMSGGWFFDQNRTALHRACAAGHEQIVAYLLELRANPNTEDAEDRNSTAMM